MFILRRYDRIPTINVLFISYEETTNSRVTCYNEKEAATLFLKTKSGRDLALMRGWKDETDEYNKHLQMQQEIVDSEKLSNKRSTIENKKTKTKSVKPKSTAVKKKTTSRSAAAKKKKK